MIKLKICQKISQIAVKKKKKKNSTFPSGIRTVEIDASMHFSWSSLEAHWCANCNHLGTLNSSLSMSLVIELMVQQEPRSCPFGAPICSVRYEMMLLVVTEVCSTSLKVSYVWCLLWFRCFNLLIFLAALLLHVKLTVNKRCFWLTSHSTCYFSLSVISNNDTQLLRSCIHFK